MRRDEIDMHAPVAQLDRALDSDSKGRWFESSRAYQTFKPEANVNMVLHQVFDTMLSFAARVLGGEMPDDDAATQWAFEQIYSFVVPNVREELLISSGSTPA